MSAKLCTLGHLTIVISKYSYEVKMFMYDVTTKILSLNPNYIVNVIVRPKFVNCSISIREVIISLIL